MRKKLPANLVTALATQAQARRAYLALLVATAIWGVATPIIKLTLNHTPVYTFLFYRFLIVCILILPYLFFELKKNPIHKSDYKNIILLGITGQAAILIVFWAIKYTSPIDVALIGAIGPLVTLTAGNIIYKEKLNKYVKYGVLIAVLGTLVIILEPILSSVKNHSPIYLKVFGNILMVFYTMSFSAYIILSKHMFGRRPVGENKLFERFGIRPMGKKYPEVLIVALTFFVALAVVIPLFVWENTAGGKSIALTEAFLPSSLIGIVYMAIFSSIVAYMCFEWGVSRAAVIDTAIFGYLDPLFNIPASFIILGIVPTVPALFGSAIIALGVVIAEKNKG